jgi:16S rRNA U516 pseudouridylate synthase RsuA-like enzyme
MRPDIGTSKVARVAVYFTERQARRLREIAAAEGCSVSTLVRRVTIQQFRLPVEAPPGVGQRYEGP